MKDEMEDLEHEIRAWTTRPPERPPGAARTRVLARLGRRRARPRWSFAAAAAILVLALASALLLRVPQPPSPAGVPTSGPVALAAAGEPAAALLVYELRSGTKLYFAMTGSRTADEPPAPSAFQR